MKKIILLSLTLAAIFLFSSTALAKTAIKIPVASKESGKYDSSISVVFSGDYENAKIFYTLDGSIPSRRNKSAKVWNGEEIKIKTTLTLKAISFDNSKKSKMSTYRYTITNDYGIKAVPDDIFDYLYMTQQEISKKLGAPYKRIESASITNLAAVGYYYKGIGTLDFEYGISSLASDKLSMPYFIECDDNIEINGAKNGMTFKEVQARLGKSKVEKNQEEYEINYYRGDIKIKYLSWNIDGSGGRFNLYRYSFNTPFSTDEHSAVFPAIKSDVKRKIKNGDTLTVEIRRGSYTGPTSAIIEQLDENFNKIDGLDLDITDKLQLNFDGFDKSSHIVLPSLIYKYKVVGLNPNTKYFRIAVKYSSFGIAREEPVYSDLYGIDNTIK